MSGWCPGTQTQIIMIWIYSSSAALLVLRELVSLSSCECNVSSFHPRVASKLLWLEVKLFPAISTSFFLLTCNREEEIISLYLLPSYGAAACIKGLLSFVSPRESKGNCNSGDKSHLQYYFRMLNAVPLLK